MRQTFLFILLFCFMSSNLVHAQETFTLTTYYPAPFGVYTELRTQRMAIGDVWFDPAQRPWNVAGDSLTASEIPEYTDLVVRDYVGLGTWQPRVRLDIRQGAIRIDDPRAQDVDGHPSMGVTLNLVESLYGSGGWAREYNFTYEDDNVKAPPVTRFALGARIRSQSLGRTLRYGYLGIDYADPWVMFTPDKKVGIGVPEDQLPEATLDVRGDALIVPRATANPASPVNGMAYYNSSSNEFRFRENNAWRSLGGGIHIEQGQIGNPNACGAVRWQFPIPVPSGYARDNCKLFVSMGTYGWLGQNKSCGQTVEWQDDTSNAAQWLATCRHQDGDVNDSCRWREGQCNYQIICQ